MVLLELYLGHHYLKRKRKRVRKKYNIRTDKSLSGKFAKTLYNIIGVNKK